MDYTITAEPGFLRVKLIGRETVRETQQLIRAVAEENRGYRRSFILFDIRQSRPLFHVEPPASFGCMREVSSDPALRIALLSDTIELRLSNEYLALLARQQGLNVQSFRGESEALKWLTDRREDRRRRLDRRQYV